MSRVALVIIVGLGIALQGLGSIKVGQAIDTAVPGNQMVIAAGGVAHRTEPDAVAVNGSGLRVFAPAGAAERIDSLFFDVGRMVLFGV